MVRPAGTVLYGRLEGKPTKAVFVARVRARSGGEETAWMLAVPAEPTEERAHPVSMIGGHGEEIPGTEHTKIIALRSLDAWKPRRPKRAQGVRTWKDPESAPRPDALERLLSAMVRDGTGAPLDPIRPEEFHYSDQTGEQTGAGSGSESEESQGAAAPTASRLVVIAEEEDADEALLTAALKGLGDPPKRPGKHRSRRSSVDGSVAESRRGAGRSSREEAGGGRKHGSGRGRSPSLSESSEEKASRSGGKDRRRGSKAKKDRAPPSPSDSSPSSSADYGGHKRHRDRDRDRGRDRDRDRRRRRRSPDSSSSSGSESRKGRGSRKIATYEKLKRKFDRKPIDRWRYVEKQAALSGYTGSNAVELYVGECTKLGKARSTAYLGAILARIGHEAANGRAELAAGLAAGALGFLDTLYVQGETDLAWRTTLGEDPTIVTRSPTLPKSQGIPENGPRPKAAAHSNVAFAHRMAFSQLIPAEVLEGTLEAGKQWKAWDELTRQS